MRRACGAVILIGGCLYQDNPSYDRQSAASTSTSTSASTSTSSTTTLSTSTSASTSMASSSTSTSSSTSDTGPAETGSSSTGTPLDPDLLLYTTLDDDGAISDPLVGDGSNFQNAVDGFTDGIVGNAAFFNTSSAHVTYRAIADGTQNYDSERGTFDFYFRPEGPREDGQQRLLADTDPLTLRVSKGPNDNFRVAIVDDQAFTFATRVDGSLIGWEAGEWVRYTVTWDTTVVGEPMVHVYVDGNEVPSYIEQPNGPVNAFEEFAMDRVMFGGGNDGGVVNGDIDEFKIFGVVKPPQ